MSSLPQVEDSPTWRRNPPSEPRIRHHEQSTSVKPLVKLEISLDPEFVKRIDELVELLGYKSREELAHFAIRRFVGQVSYP